MNVIDWHNIATCYNLMESVAHIDSRKRRLADRFHASRSIRRIGYRLATGWTRDEEPIGVQAVVHNDIQMVAEIEVSHPFETTEVPRPSETEALDPIETIPHTTTKAHAMDDMEVTSPVKTEVTAYTSIELYVHTDGGFPGRPSDCFVLTRYVDHVAFRLWQGEVCI